MAGVPPLSYRKAERALGRLGFQAIRQKGSHIFFQHPDGRSTVVPKHPGKDLRPRLVKKILDDAGVDWATFRDAM